jgi:flagellar biosynthesis anti-sigma factor FlgM
MKVTQNPPSTTHSIEQAKTKPVQPKSRDGIASDEASSIGKQGARVEISDEARLMQQATDLAKAAPDVRADRVAALKKSVQEGTYRVDAHKIADKLVDEHLANDFGKNSL